MIQRYKNVSTYMDINGNVFSNRYSRLDSNAPFYEIVTTKKTTLYELSFQHYGTPLLFWLIGDINNYLDPRVSIEEGVSLKVPIGG